MGEVEGWRKSGGTALVAAHVPPAVVSRCLPRLSGWTAGQRRPASEHADPPPAPPSAAVFLLFSFVFLFTTSEDVVHSGKMIIKSPERRRG